MQTVSVYLHSSPRSFLSAYVEARKKVDPQFSIRKFSKEVGTLSHALLTLVLQGKRPLTLKQVPALARTLGLSHLETQYLQTLVQLESSQSIEEKVLVAQWLKEQNPGQLPGLRETTEYRILSEWIHFALLALTFTRGSFSDAQVALKKLIQKWGDQKLDRLVVQSAIDRLVECGLLEFKEGVYCATCQNLTSPNDVLSKGARAYHKQVLKLASEALEAQTVEEREFQSFALAVPFEKISLAKEMIRKFKTQFVKEIGVDSTLLNPPADYVYQVSMQFFRLTEHPLAIGPKEDEGAGQLNSRSKK